MTLRIGQAIYGEQDRGHALLAASPAAVDAGSIAGRMDIQGTVPPGTQWRPYVSGFAHGEQYILSRTSADPDARRSGMVFSRAFFIPLGCIGKLDDLATLFVLLGTWGQRRDVEDFDVPPGKGEAIPDSALAHALLTPGAGPVVWPREDGFAEAIAGLWQNLWPEARASFSFRLAFSPQDVAAAPPTIVAIPEGLAARWSGFRIVGDAPASLSLEGALLAGKPEAANLSQLRTDLDAKLSTMSDLLHLTDILKSLTSQLSLDDILGALRATAYVSSNPGSGRSIKSALIARAVSGLGTAKPEDVRMARNLDLSAFSEASSFWEAMERWAANGLWQSNDSKVSAQIIVESTASTGPVPEWRRAIAGGIKSGLAKAGDKTVDALWKIIAASPSALQKCMEYVGTAARLEARLLARAPGKLPTDTGRQLREVAVRAKLPKLAAMISAITFGPLEAVQMQIDSGDDSREHLETALFRATGKAKIEIALQVGNRDLYQIAGAAAHEDPALLKRIDIQNEHWREIWREAIFLDAALWQSPRNPRAAADALYRELANGSTAPVHLLRALAPTPLGDISRHPERVRLWSSIPDDIRGVIAERTADGFNEAYHAGDTLAPVEPELVASLLDRARLDATLDQLANEPTLGIEYFRILPELGEGRFISWVRAVMGKPYTLKESTAESFGRLIVMRDWRSAARDLLNMYSSRRDLRPALQICADLFSYYTCWLHDLGQCPPSSAKWQILTEVAIELYPYGPDQNELWSRAGGKKSNLPRRSTGDEIWRHVIGQASLGRLDVDIRELIKQMAKDFPGNSALQRMRRDPLFEGRWG